MSTEAKKLQERLNAIALERLGDTEKEDGAKSKGNSKSNSSSKSKDKSSKDKARRDKSPSKERRDKDKPSSKDREKDRDKDKDKKKRDKKRREEDDTRPLSEKISSTFARVGAGISQKLSSVPEDKKPPQKVPPSTALAGPGYSPSSLEEGRASYDGGGGTRRREAAASFDSAEEGYDDFDDNERDGEHGHDDGLGKKIRKGLRKTIKKLSNSRFIDWNRHELVMLLVKRGVELRGEAAIAHQTLVDMADETYYGERMPEKPPNFTIWELLKVSWAIAKVQDRWIEKMYRRRIEALNEGDAGAADVGEADQEQRLLQAFRDIEAGEAMDDDDPEAFPSIETLYPGDTSGLSAADAEAIHSGSSTSFREDDNGMAISSIDQKSTETVKSYMDKARPVSMITQAMHLPWAGPDWEKAVVHADYTNPRRGGKGGKSFSFYNTTTGRYCCLSGCGEQCDLFREGQISEFGIFGAGVSCYFKFLKWLIGLFLLLSIFSLPLITLNYFGRAYDLSDTRDWRDLARPSLGNLLPDTIVNNSDSGVAMGARETYIVNSTTIIVVSVPLCIPTEQYLSFFEGPDPDLDCILGKDTVAYYYMWMDLLICFAVFIAYLWLKYFEDAANRKMEAFTVYASMYVHPFLPSLHPF